MCKILHICRRLDLFVWCAEVAVLTNPLDLFLFLRVLSGGCGFNIEEPCPLGGNVRASNHRKLEFGEYRFAGKGSKKMRFSLAVAVVMAGISVSGWAQQNNQFKVKATHEKPAKQSAPLTKAPSAGNTAANADAKALQNVERQSVKGSGHAAAGKKAPALKPVKEKPDPSMNFNGTGGGGTKGPGRSAQSSNPYKGRLKQKGGGGGGGHQ